MSANEIRDAITVLQQERLMWSTLTNFSAHVSVEFGDSGEAQRQKHGTFECDLSFQQTSPNFDQHSKFLNPCKITLASKKEDWVLTSDGNVNDTKIRHTDNTTDKQLDEYFAKHPKQIDQLLQIPMMIMLPKMRLLLCYQDKLCSISYFRSLSDMTQTCPPRRNSAKSHLAHSYIFNDKTSHFASVSFADGHIAQCELNPGKDGKMVNYLNAVRVNGFWFPTEVEVCSERSTQDMQVNIEVSNINVGNGDQ
ncbi:MAG: hypothetical protein P4L50_28380 [Anaerolineaceae bacterium]|nr:hypothetical protein [Anaerolineaceae bacterium]